VSNVKNNSEQTIIAVDAMGGDNAPREIVLGAAKVTLETSVKVKLVGDENIIREILDNTEYNSDQLEIVHTTQVISNDDHPKEVIRRKTDASMVVAAKLCGQGEAHGLVSAGNTGAFVLSSVKHIPRIKGISKTAIASVYPTQNMQKREDIFSLLLDIGANIHCSTKDLVHFAIMGKLYASDIKGIANPTVGLLNLGKEPHKGGEILSQVYKILTEMENINFIGNIEGNDIMKGKADVVITEGFVGNVVLKTIEGIAETLTHLGKYAFKHRLIWKLGLMALSGGIKQMKKVTDYSEYGGAPLLGFQEIVIKAHGRSKAKAITNAIKVAAKTHRDKVCTKIANEINQIETKFDIH